MVNLKPAAFNAFQFAACCITLRYRNLKRRVSITHGINYFQVFFIYLKRMRRASTNQNCKKRDGDVE